jgi:hypothetical protein
VTEPIGRFCVAITAIIVTCAPRAQALELAWQAPDGCPAASDVLKDVLRLAGATEGKALVAQAVVTHSQDKRWQVAIALSGSATGHRTLIADNCAQLARASALIIALSANPDAALDLPADEPPPQSVPDPAVAQAARPVSSAAAPAVPASAKSENAEPHAESPSGSKAAKDREGRPKTPASKAQKPKEAEPEEAEPKEAKPEQRSRLPIELLLRGGFESGSLPTSTLWTGVGARTKLPRRPFSVALTGYVTQRTEARFSDWVGARFRAAAAQGRFCVEPPLTRRWVVAACGGLQLAWVNARGFADADKLRSNGYVGTTSTRNRWAVAPLGSLGTQLEFYRKWSIDLGADLMVPVKRWEFVVDELGRLFRPEPVQFLLYLGLGYRVN